MPEATSSKTYDVVMIGAGPACLSAAIYTTREDLDTVLLEKGVIGGLAAITDSVENYPGFPDGVGGLELANNLRAQAERFGATIDLAEATEIHAGKIERQQTTVNAIHDDGELKRVVTTDGDYLARAVLIGTGTSYVKLGVPGEEEFYGRGVHYCATCDGALYRDKRLVVVGSGNSSAQESLFLTRFASHIDILIRGDSWKASDVLIERIAADPKITVHFSTTTERIVGEDMKVTKVVGHNKLTDQDEDFDTDGVFVFVGLFPNTTFLESSDILLDERKFIVTDDSLETKMSGVFAAGDVRSGATMQIASAVGEGATAALKIREYLEKDI